MSTRIPLDIWYATYDYLDVDSAKKIRQLVALPHTNIYHDRERVEELLYEYEVKLSPPDIRALSQFVVSLPTERVNIKIILQLPSSCRLPTVNLFEEDLDTTSSKSRIDLLGFVTLTESVSIIAGNIGSVLEMVRDKDSGLCWSVHDNDPYQIHLEFREKTRDTTFDHVVTFTIEKDRCTPFK